LSHRREFVGASAIYSCVYFLWVFF
jgi:hypothetical protein